MKISSLLFTLLLFSICVQAQTPSQDAGILSIKKTKDFEVSGKGDAANWKETSFVALTHRKGNKQYSSQFKILYSEKGIYCLYVSQDSLITSTIREDFADIYNEDVVEVFFWPNEKSNIYFEYELSPYNYELPILVPNYEGKFLGWRPWHYEGDRLTRHAASINKTNGKVTSWTAEFFIPYTLLAPLQNVPPVSGTSWRANFYRIDYDNNTSQWSWMPTRKNFHDYEKFGRIIFE
ncbi:MAG: carbohydrate-binding family 9-like protein [Bacteroidota bacterium]